MADRAPAPAGSDAHNAKATLLLCLQDNTQPLLDSIRVYVQRFGLASESDATTIAQDILQEVSLEALEHADRFTPDRRPLPWLLGIALNIIRRRNVARARRARREVPAGTYSTLATELETEADPFEQTIAPPALDQLVDVEADDEAKHLLALVPTPDREVLRLAVIEGWNHAELAQRLGITPGAARVRLHRAIARLRAAWLAYDTTERVRSESEESHDQQR